MTEIRCGTVTSFLKGCKCPLCMATWERYKHLHLPRRLASKKRAGTKRVTCGTYNKYSDGCRCWRCRYAKKMYEAGLKRRNISANIKRKT